MCCHDHIYSGFNRFTKRRELHAVQPLPAMRHTCQAVMRVDRRIAMPRKVLGCGADSLALVSTDRSDPMLGNSMRIFTERANADYRIGRVVIDIDTRRKVEINAEGS
ncbi:hypothetical protein D3C77_407670 [compost metagenome]